MKKSIIHFTAGTPGAQESGGKTKDATATTLPAATTAKKEPVLVMKDRKSLTPKKFLSISHRF